MFSPKLFAYEKTVPGPATNPLDAVEVAARSNISRRDFLVGGVALSGLSLAAPSAMASASVSIEKTHFGLIVHIGGTQWRIPRAAFGKHARLQFSVNGPEAMICVRYARFEGTSLTFNLDLKLFNVSHGGSGDLQASWRLELHSDQLGYASQVPYVDWLREQTTAESRPPVVICRRITKALGLKLISATPGTLALRPDLQWHMGAIVRLQGTEGAVECRSFQVRIETPTEGAFYHLIDRLPSEWSTRIASQDVEILPSRFITAGTFASGTICQIHSSGLTSATLQRIAGATPQHIIGLTGSWRVRAVTNKGSYGGGFESNSGSVFIGERRGVRHIAAVLPLQDKLHNIKTEMGPVAVRGLDPSHRVALYAVGSEMRAAEARASATIFSLPLPGADYSRLELDETEVLFKFDDRTMTSDLKSLPALKEPQAALSRPDSTVTVLGLHGDRCTSAGHKCELPLDSASLRILHADDLLSLTLKFRGLKLVSGGHRKPWRIIPTDPRPPGTAGRKRPILIVEFPPQHVMEQTYAGQLNDQDIFTLAEPNALISALAEARISGLSRLAFEAPPATGPRSGGLDYTLEALTSWEALPLIVSHRAEDYSTDGTVSGLKNLLTARGISATHSRETRWNEVLNPLVEPPEAAETAIELPARLVISPDARAVFRTPKALHGGEKPRPASDRPIPLWQARLDVGPGPNDTKGIRAIWSPDFEPKAIKEPNHPYPPTDDVPWQGDVDGGDAPRRLRVPTAAADRHQLVVLSSAFGLPTLPRLQEIHPGADGKPISQGQYQVFSPSNFNLDRDTDLKSWRIDVGDPNADQGIYIPPSMPVRELLLSSLGGSVDVSARFEPPAAPNSLFVALSLEKWNQITVLGRDITCEVDYKGFLFPLGHRCTWVRLTERL